MTELRPCCRRFLGEGYIEARFPARLRAQLALFDRVSEVPGGIVELGVGSGVSLRAWVHFVAEHGPNRVIWAYDTFAGFPPFVPEDGQEIPALGKRVGGETELRDRPTTKREVMRSVLAMFDRWPADVFLDIVEGNIAWMLPRYTPLAPVALVFCDADTYAPTKAALDVLWPRLAPGGLIVFDEYGHQPWPGETKAVDEWLAVNPELKLERLSMESGPEAYVVKP